MYASLLHLWVTSLSNGTYHSQCPSTSTLQLLSYSALNESQTHSPLSLPSMLWAPWKLIGLGRAKTKHAGTGYAFPGLAVQHTTVPWDKTPDSRDYHAPCRDGKPAYRPLKDRPWDGLAIGFYHHRRGKDARGFPFTLFRLYGFGFPRVISNLPYQQLAWPLRDASYLRLVEPRLSSTWKSSYECLYYYKGYKVNGVMVQFHRPSHFLHALGKRGEGWEYSMAKEPAVTDLSPIHLHTHGDRGRWADGITKYAGFLCTFVFFLLRRLKNFLGSTWHRSRVV